MLANVLVQTTAVDLAGAAYIPPTLVAVRSACREQAGPTPRPVVSPFERDWYARQWRGAGEPSLTLNGRGEALRFTWLRSFDRPVFVRIDGLSSRRPRLVARELTGRGGYDPGVVKRQLDRSLTAAETTSLRERVAQVRLAEQPPSECDRIGMDGAQWLFETRGRDGYHLLVRWSPDPGGLRELGLAMMALTGWELGELY